MLIFSVACKLKFKLDIKKVIRQDSIYAKPINLVKVPFEYSIDIDTREDLLMARLIHKEFNIKVY